MSQGTKDIDFKSLLTDAYISIEKLKRRVDQFEQKSHEPIAVIGIGCRFPGGADSPDALWQLLEQGGAATIQVPPDRWDIDAYYDADPDAEGKMYSRWGGFINHVDRFDPRFFGITPREAFSMDPQQRILLEVAWEALENAACSPEKLENSQTGVFIGIGGGDYAALMSADKRVRELYSGTGTALSVAAGRISYVLGLQGPCISVDTACSASLVSVHLAVQSLRMGESNVALAGGVNLLLSPEPTIIFCKGRMLSFGPYCRTFDAAADGYVRGEGCGMVVLKRLSDALTDGDRIMALIKGSAINQDGRSSGLTAPNGIAQQAVIRSALLNARVKASQVSYIEAHGTGTALGDPIEISALNEVIGKDHDLKNPVWVGSVKTNFGHLEAAAGISSLIKAVLALYHGKIPPHLHLETPSPHIAWEKIPIRIPTEVIPWPNVSDRPIAGVSSFGFSGTNAHMILQAPPEVKQAEPSVERPLHILPLSARNADSLKTLVQTYSDHLSGHPDHAIQHVCYTAGIGRSHFRHRMAVVAGQREDFIEKLATFDWDKEVPGVLRGYAPEGGRGRKIAFLFTGQGSQYTGMGRGFYETQPAFRDALNQCDDILRGFLKKSILSIIYPDKDSGAESQLNQTMYTQPALFALEYALTQLWHAWGVNASAVMGHSVGEYVAACVAGVFSLEQGLRLIAERGRLMQALPPNGGMAALFTDEQRVAAFLSDFQATVSIAAINGPENTVISGIKDDVQMVLNHFEQQGIRGQELNVSHAFHSPLMEPMLAEFEKSVSETTFSKPRIRIISNLTGQPADSQEMVQSQRWCRHILEPVRFSDSIHYLAQQGIELFLEVGPHPVLSGMAQQCLVGDNRQWMASMRRGKPDWQQMLDTLGRLYVNGVAVDWDGFDRYYGRVKVALPTYPFQRKRYWHGNGSHVGDNEEESTETAVTPIENMLYEVEWLQAPVLSKDQPFKADPDKIWMILADKAGYADEFAGILRNAGGKPVLVFSGDVFQADNDRYTINPYISADYKRLLKTLYSSHETIVEIVHLWSMDSKDVAKQSFENKAQLQRLCGSILNLLQAIDNAGKLNAARVRIITAGGQSLNSSKVDSLAEGALWGLGRTIILEHPELIKGLIDLDCDNPTTAMQLLFSEINSNDDELQVRYVGTERQVARLKSVERLTSTSVSIGPDETYLITGGMGALGLTVAQWLADQGAHHIALVGRSKPSDASMEKIKRIQASGCQVTIKHADVSDIHSILIVIDEIHQSLPPLTGVIHAAGVLDDGVLMNQDWDRFERVMAPKAIGAWNLHLATQDLNLKFFILFSSVASVLGAAGQGNYAAANAYLDALARFRVQAGLPGVSIAWGPWASGGMAAELEGERQKRLIKTGLGLIDPSDALKILSAVLVQAKSQVCVIDADWKKFVQQLTPNRNMSFFSLCDGVQLTDQSRKTEGANALQGLISWEKQSETQRRSFLEEYLRGQVSRIIGMDTQSFSAENNFVDLGIDSLMITELINKIRQDFGLSLYAREVFERPAIDQLTEYIDLELLRSTKKNLITNRNLPNATEASAIRTPLRKNLSPPANANPPMVFLLSSPRSGSTLLRVMLAGHSMLFCPPELHLLQFSSLSERHQKLGESYLTEGLVRALMETNNIDPDQSKTLIKELTQRDEPIQKVYRLLQESVHPRLLLDKSPTYGADTETLQKAESLFTQPKYIHLVRHPYSVIESFVRNRMERLVGIETEDPSRLAEQVWCETTANIIDFFEGVDPERHCTVSFEELVRTPEKVARDLCSFLEISFEHNLLNPYEGNRMTDGLHKHSLGIGDPNFLEHKTIDANLADVWKSISLGRKLGGYARRIARELDYPIPEGISGNGTTTEEREEIII